MTENDPFVSRAHHVRTKSNSDITKAQFITGGAPTSISTQAAQINSETLSP